MPFQLLYNQVFHKQPSDASNPAMLQQLVKEYPYFSLAHFFLLKQSNPSEIGYDTMAAKTALHFNNPFFLMEQIHKIAEPALEAAAAVAPIEELEEQANPSECVDTDVSPEMDRKESNPALAQPIVEQTPIVPEKEPLLFEPLYATDYFASQGIKLRDDMPATDKLGKQLKSFTDWLKTMKKVHESKLPAGSETLDISVQTLAEKSNLEEEVITETMAEVFFQQGKLHKAKEIYEKLSLLNPSKIAYFAAKIEQIQ
jgi:hypothetical protein